MELSPTRASIVPFRLQSCIQCSTIPKVLNPEQQVHCLVVVHGLSGDTRCEVSLLSIHILLYGKYKYKYYDICIIESLQAKRRETGVQPTRHRCLVYKVNISACLPLRRLLIVQVYPNRSPDDSLSTASEFCLLCRQVYM